MTYVVLAVIDVCIVEQFSSYCFSPNLQNYYNRALWIYLIDIPLNHQRALG